MPMNAMTSPLQVIYNLFDARDTLSSSWWLAVQDHFKAEMAKPGVMSGLTSLNVTANHSLSEGQLVKFRCMVQDMFDPEYYMAEYKVKNLKDGSVKVRTGRFRDTVQCGPGEEIVEEDPGNMDLRERVCLYCVSPPGEAAWVAEHYQRQEAAGSSAGPSGTQANILKRSLDTEEEDIKDGEDSVMDTETKDKDNTIEKIKRQKASIGNGCPPTNHNKVHINLNLPIPSANGRACIVKVCDTMDGEFKLHDLVEFVGVVSLDPVLSVTEEGEEATMSTSPSLPPPSLVPRLHVLTYARLEHNNPLVPQPPTMAPTLEEVARVELHTLLTTCLLGDKLAADYLLLHLISRVYTRKDVLVLGKLSLNLHNMTTHEEWPRRLATILSLITSNSHYLPMTRNNLDSASFAPRKDYEANRLVSGSLQLASGTHLWLDETAMTDGQLSQVGVKNLTSLGNLISWQKLEYDFEFQRMEYETDVACLVMSEGRSMLPSDVQLLVRPEGVEARPDLISKTFSEVGAELSGELLDRLRRYITTARMGEFNLTDQVMKAVQDDFVSMRQTDQGITMEQFHSLLVLGRLGKFYGRFTDLLGLIPNIVSVSLSYGRSTLTPGDWEDAKRMEKERKERAASLPARGGAHMANGMNVHLHNNQSQ